MTHEASKALADRLDDYAAHADLADKGSEAVDLRDAAAALRSQPGTLAREEVARITPQHIADYLFEQTTNLGSPITYTACLTMAKYILSLPPSHEAGTQEPTDEQLTEWVQHLDWDTGLSTPDEIKQLRALLKRIGYVTPAGTQEPVADWQLVPVEPTLEMLKVGYAALKLFVPDDETPIGQFRIYEAMLEAAPAAPASQDATREALEKIVTIALAGQAPGAHRQVCKCTVCEMRHVAEIALASPARADRAVTADERAIQDIAAERQRQISSEGWTSIHDDQHNTGEMARAAACYALSAGPEKVSDLSLIHKLWPWEWRWFKPRSKREDLVRAGALIAAEIERLDRICSFSPPNRTKEGGR